MKMSKPIRSKIFSISRLLERRLYTHFFIKSDLDGCLKALAAYQNADGGFGHGLEPDLMTPSSTAIAAETALVILDMLDARPTEILEPLTAWVESNLSEQGVIPHPPADLEDYPHQPWWRNPDDDRILAVAGWLKKIGYGSESLFSQVRAYFETTSQPETDNFYAYTHLVYLKHCAESRMEMERLSAMQAALPEVAKKHKDHFPFFSRYWYPGYEFLPVELQKTEADWCLKTIEENVGLPNPYSELPWWGPIFTLDALILLKRAGYSSH